MCGSTVMYTSFSCAATTGDGDLVLRCCSLSVVVAAVVLEPGITVTGVMVLKERPLGVRRMRGEPMASGEDRASCCSGCHWCWCDETRCGEALPRCVGLMPSRSTTATFRAHCLCAHACDMNIRLVMGHGAFCAGACAKLSIRRRTNSTMRRKQQQQQQRQQQQQQQAVEARERRQHREQNLAPFSKMNGWTTSRNCWIAHTCLLRDGDAVSWLLRANSSTTAVPCSFMREAI